MNIYIASSWKNQHAVEMLTGILRDRGSEVASWVDNNYGENHNHVTKRFDFETWVNSPESDQSFKFDTNGAMQCSLFIYVGSAGKDAAAECGMAYANQRHMIGLWSKGEDFGLMRKMFYRWFTRVQDLLDYVDQIYSLYDSANPPIIELGMPSTVGELKNMIRDYPDSTPFGFRNQPMQTLFAKNPAIDQDTSVFFQ